MAIKPRSLGSPFHLGRMMAFSGCVDTCSGSVSSMITLERSRLRYDKSWSKSLAEESRTEEGKCTLTILPLIDRVASRKSL